jgi:hypothetical protein
MKKLILALLLIPAVSFAETLPPGCYVADDYRTDECWGEDSNYFLWADARLVNPDELLEYYGTPITAIIQQHGLCLASNDAARRTNANNKKLITKLRKACGSACKKIK